jgi:hypothetical protein
MRHPDDPVTFPTDPHPVRPGTSDALFARTIDATPQPPLVQAQESVAAAIPRLTATLSDPLFVATLVGTLLLMWMVVRMRSRLRPVLLAAMLLMTLTSFRPTRVSVEAPISDDDFIAQGYERARRYERPETRERPERRERREVAPRPDQTPFVFRMPTRPEKLRPNRDRIRQDEEELRAAIEELRQRIEAELRRRGEHRYYQIRSARWVRRLPPALQEWVVVGQQVASAWERDR